MDLAVFKPFKDAYRQEIGDVNSNGGGKTKNPAGLVSQPCQKDYQSHYVEVTHEGYPVKAEGLGVVDNAMVGSTLMN